MKITEKLKSLREKDFAPLTEIPTLPANAPRRASALPEFPRLYELAATSGPLST
jgi:hypothetical protein